MADNLDDLDVSPASGWVMRGSAWSVVPLSVIWDQRADDNDLQCASPTFCAIAYAPPDSNSHIRVTTWDGTSWSAVQSLTDTLGDGAGASLSCLAPRFCMLSDGGDTWVYRSGTWSSIGLLPGYSDDLSYSNPTCVTPEYCVLVTTTTTYLWNGTTWQRLPGLAGSGGHVVCTRVSTCVSTVAAADHSARAISTWNGTAWSPPVTVVPTTGREFDGIYSLACPAVGTCVAITGVGGIVRSTAGQWSPLRNLATSMLPQKNFPSLSCPTMTTCFATMSPDTVGTFDP